MASVINSEIIVSCQVIKGMIILCYNLCAVICQQGVGIHNL